MLSRHLSTENPLLYFFVALCMGLSSVSFAETKPHHTAIKTNAFARDLVSLSRHLVENRDLVTRESWGGYGGITNDLRFYQQIEYLQKPSLRVISIIQWERKNPQNLHDVIVNIYDQQGRLIRDYSASYLTTHRNAPSQTLINLHYYNGNLHGFRQFDALDNRIYEYCSGSYQQQAVVLSFDYEEIPDTPDDIKDKKLRQAYLACFKNAAISAQPYTNPLREIRSH